MKRLKRLREIKKTEQQIAELRKRLAWLHSLAPDDEPSERNIQIIEMRNAGITYREIGERVGLTRQHCRSIYEQRARYERHPTFRGKKWVSEEFQTKKRQQITEQSHALHHS